jgi:hypothetical protein
VEMRRIFENMNEKNETKTIRFKKELNNEFFWVRVAMPKDMTMTIYLSDFIFLNDIKDERLRKYKLQELFRNEGRPGDYIKSQLDEIQLISINRVEPIWKIFEHEG